jgi:hypothetical protein
MKEDVMTYPVHEAPAARAQSRDDSPDAGPSTYPVAQRPAAAREFHVTDEKTANWLLRKLANLEAERLRIEEQAKKMLAALKADQDELMLRYGPELEAWARQELLDGGNRKKTVHTWQATLSFRTVAAHLKLTDPEQALQYALENAPNLVQTIRKLDTTSYRAEAARRLDMQGEILPGIERIPETESFTIRFGKKEDAGEEA